METGILAAGKEISLARFAIDSLSSNSCKEQLAGVLILDSLLQQKEDLVSRIACSSEAVSALIGMLGWTDGHDGDIRLLAARVTAKLAGSLRVAATPSMLKLVSSLLDAKDQLATGLSSANPVGGNNTPRSAGIKPCRHDSYVSHHRRRMKERWTITEELPLTHQDSFPVLGMLILERLASDHDNCAEICRATDLVSKITGFISYISDNSAQQKAVVCSSLSLVRRLAITGGKVGVLLRQELWEDPFLLDNLVMENIMAVEGKQMETLFGLVSQICNIIPECVVHSLESHLSISAFVQKMVNALHANKKPRHEHPRMRRVVIELTMSIIESHPRYTTIFIEGGMMEALSKIESIPSKVERYRIFLGNAGVVLESGLPLLTIMAKAKRLFDSATPGAQRCSLPNR